MGTRDESENRTGLCAVDDDDRDIGRRVDASGNFEIACGFFTSSGRGCTHREGLALGQHEEWKQEDYQAPAKSMKG
jgi:hypothetical protein